MNYNNINPYRILELTYKLKETFGFDDISVSLRLIRTDKNYIKRFNKVNNLYKAYIEMEYNHLAKIYYTQKIKETLLI